MQPTASERRPPTPPPLPPLPSLSADRAPATDAAKRVMATLEQIEGELTQTRFQAQTIADPERGVFYWDCSGMATWILRRAAPVARSAIRSRRPVARDYFKVMAHSPSDEPRYGWMKIAHPQALRPGDMFAWLKPPKWKRANTGHVGFVLTTAKPHPWFAAVWLVRIADATTVGHGDDTRAADGEGGFGSGTLAFHVDADGSPLAYGWYGARQHPRNFVPTRITFGRVFR